MHVHQGILQLVVPSAGEGGISRNSERRGEIEAADDPFQFQGHDVRFSMVRDVDGEMELHVPAEDTYLRAGEGNAVAAK
jgi:hypothetical protein